MMFFAYMFVDVMSPLQSLVKTRLGWSAEAFGYYAGAEYMLNVFGFLILAGIILDKMGVRITGSLHQTLRHQRLVHRIGFVRMARFMVDGNARHSQTCRLGLHDFRMRL